MSREEQMAFEYGKTFDVSSNKIACCYDERMKSLVSERRTERGHVRNTKNMMAWWKGVVYSNPQISIPKCFSE